MQRSQVEELYQSYLVLAPDYAYSLDQIYEIIAQGEGRGFSLDQLVYGYIESLIFMKTHTWEEIIELAGGDKFTDLKALLESCYAQETQGDRDGG